MDRILGRCRPLLLLLLFSTAVVAPLRADKEDPFAGGAPLPPLPPWEGASRELMAAADDPWITPAEVSGLVSTPSYDETFAWLRRLVAAAPQLEMVCLGKSGEGRDVWMVIASADGAASPGELHASKKPVLLAQAGIHSGEIDGKDAGLMLLRDLTVGGRESHLLDGASFLFVPILNVDGHERSSLHGRINQRGPERMGWRTNARNLNLNRDYAKLDTEALQALVGSLSTWRPDLYLDLHVTDGIDYQYDITWGASGSPIQGFSPATSQWLDTIFDPAVAGVLRDAGHIPGPLMFAINNLDYTGGLFDWTAASPRFSDGYGNARHLPTVLVENHSLKPYDQRVLGTYVLLRGALATLAEKGEELRRAVAADRARRPPVVPLAWKVPDGAEPEKVEILAIASRREPSAISGGEKVVWTGEPVTLEVDRYSPTEVVATVERPAAYWIPPAWTEVIERLRIHGIEMETIAEPRTLEVEMYRLGEPTFDPAPFEGHLRLTAESTVERRRETFPAGSLRISTDQPLGDLAILLLEPASPDSFFQWGFFLEILQRTEYVEGYVMEPLAKRMLEHDEALRQEYEEALENDPELAGDPRARLQWLYQRTPYFDPHWRLYPVARER